jgi:hypothetical protein
LSKAQSDFDILGRRTFVASSQQNQHFPSLLFEIYAVSGAIINPQLLNAVSHSLDIARIPSRESFYSNKDTGTCPNFNH